MNLSELNEDDVDRLAKQWLFVQQTALDRYGVKLGQSRHDLAVIQRIVDDGVFSPDDTWQLQALGIALGRVLAENVEGLDWAIIDDQYGRDPTLRYRNTTLVFHVLTMISRRVEDGDDVDVDVGHFFDQTIEHVRDLKDNVD